MKRKHLVATRLRHGTPVSDPSRPAIPACARRVGRTSGAFDSLQTFGETLTKHAMRAVRVNKQDKSDKNGQEARSLGSWSA